MNILLSTQKRQLSAVPSVYRAVSGVVLYREPLKDKVQEEADTHSLYRRPSSRVYLLVKKPRKNHAWQFPQGGQEKEESGADAALRELREECGSELNVRLESTTEVGHYQYRFPENFVKHNKSAYEDSSIGACVSFFKAQWISGECHPDGKEIVDYAWLTKEEIEKYVHSEYQQIIQAFL